jgi:hypothetical protein
MFATELDQFSIGIIVVPTHIEPIPKLVCILDIIMAKPILKQPIAPIDVLAMKLAIPPNTIKQHLLEIFFHPKVGEMIVDETLARKQIQNLTIANWTITEEEQLTEVNLGTKKKSAIGESELCT